MLAHEGTAGTTAAGFVGAVQPFAAVDGPVAVGPEVAQVGAAEVAEVELAAGGAAWVLAPAGTVATGVGRACSKSMEARSSWYSSLVA